MDRVEQILQNNGLKLQEIRVYLALLNLRKAQTGKICKEADIASSNIYSILESLQEKGLISHQTKNNIKIFMPASPKALNQIFLDKKKQLEEEQRELIKLVSEFQSSKESTEVDYKYFEGILGIKSMWHEINSSIAKNSTIKIHTSTRESYENLIGFYDEHQKIRKLRKAKEKMIFPNEDKELAKERKKDNLVEIKFMDLKNKAEWGVINDLFYMQYSINKTPKAFLIKDEIFANTFEQVFDNLWNQAKS